MESYDHSEHIHAELAINHTHEHGNADHNHDHKHDQGSHCCDVQESHTSNNDHGHKHEHFHSPGTFNARIKSRKRKYESRAFVVGIGGPVGNIPYTSLRLYNDLLGYIIHRI